VALPLRRVAKYSYAMYVPECPLHFLVGSPVLSALGLASSQSIVVDPRLHHRRARALSFVAAAAIVPSPRSSFPETQRIALRRPLVSQDSGLIHSNTPRFWIKSTAGKENTMFPTIRLFCLAGCSSFPSPPTRGVTCDDVLKALGRSSRGREPCFQKRRPHHQQSADDAGPTIRCRAFRRLAFTPITDRGVIAHERGQGARRSPKRCLACSLNRAHRLGPGRPGARFLLRLPNDWNGRLVVAGASGTRQRVQRPTSPGAITVVQQGYGLRFRRNKGVLNLFPSPR